MPLPYVTLMDALQMLVLLLSQRGLMFFLLRDFKPRASRRIWLATQVFLGVTWFLCASAILLGMYLRRLTPGPLIWFMTIAVAVRLFWTLIATWIVILYWVYRKFSPPAASDFSSSRRNALRSVAVGASVAPVAAMVYGGVVERTRFHVKEVDLPVPGLHADLKGLRIVQISDLHVSQYLTVADAARVVDMANELRADLAVLTGDIISSSGDPLEASIRELARLRAPAGILGCHGNHEIYAGCQGLATRLGRENGIDFLRRQARALRFGNAILNVAGVDYQRKSERANYLAATERLVVPDATNLLLSHTPDVFPVAVRKGFQAMLSGHTHGGQVTVEILSQTVNLARVVTPFVSGLYRIQGRSCYVTAGIGTIGLPVRLGAQPEITLLRLVPA